MKSNNPLVNWQPIALGELIEIVMGQAPPGSECNKDGRGTIFVKAGEFAAQRPVVREWTTQPLKFAEHGDVLICVVGATSGKINLGINCAIGRSVAALRPTAALDQKYLYYFLTTKVLSLRGDSTGSAQGVVSKDDLSQIELPTAPINEQHRIVAKIEELFSELDKGIENLKTARTQLKVYRQALLKHAFEGKLTARWRAENQGKLETAAILLKRIQQERAQRYQQQLAEWEAAGKQDSKPKAPKHLPPLAAEELAELPELPEGWAWVKFGELTVSSQNGISKRRGETGRELVVLRLADITEQKISLDDPRKILLTETEIGNYRLSKDDLICIRVNGSSDLVGRIISVREDMEVAYCDHFIRYRLLNNVISPIYLQHFFNTHSVRRYVELNKVSSAGQNTVNQEMLSSVLVAVCGTGEQKVIVELLEQRLSEVDQLELTITASLQQAEALRQSILKRAFSGQLVPQDPHDEPASALLARIKAERATVAVKPRKKSVGYKLSPTEIIPLASVNKEL